MPGQFVDSDQAITDMNLIQFSEVIGPLPEGMFRAWERGESYFSQDRTTRRSEMLVDGEEGTWDFMETDDYDGSDGYSESGEEAEEEGDEEGGGGASTRRDDIQLSEADDHEDEADYDMLEALASVSAATDEEEPLIIMAPCRSLEERSAAKKPQDVNKVEEQQIVHLLRWIFQYDAAARPTAEEILGHPWFQSMG